MIKKEDSSYSIEYIIHFIYNSKLLNPITI